MRQWGSAIAASDTNSVLLHTAAMTAPASSVSSRLDVRPGLRAPDSSSGRRNNPPLAEWRKARAVELATQGYTYQQIADELGYARSSPWAWCLRCVKDLGQVLERLLGRRGGEVVAVGFGGGAVAQG